MQRNQYLPHYAKQVLYAGFVGLMLTSLTTHVVLAQDGVGVRVQPSTVDERADPGTALDGVLTVTNQDGGKQTYYVATRNIDDMDDSGRPNFSKNPPTDPMELASWIKLSKSAVELEQGQSDEVPYRIEVPAEASPGSYFAAIFVTREAENPTESGAGVGFQVASLINLRVNGNALEGIMIREFSSDKSFYTKPSVRFNTRIENTGTVHERPMGIISITNMLGKKVGQVVLNENGGGVMPRTDRTFQTEWSTDSFTLGRYSAIASVAFGDTQKQTITRELTFWVIPVKEVGLVLGLVVLVALLITWSMRRYVRKALARAGHAGALEQNAITTSFAQRLVRTLAWLLVLLALLFIGVLVFFA
jgi:hypothetical protein